jgi:sugar O-acyltransferase (sialic acid O-acetyltransferase NeuD family)
MKLRKLVLLGGGGHCKSVIDVAEQAGYSIIGILDTPDKVGTSVLGYNVLGSDSDMIRFVDKAEFLVTVGQIKDVSLRIRLHNEVLSKGGTLATVISPRAYVSKHSLIGIGSVVMHNAFINSEVKVGMGCILNTAAHIEHDVSVGDYCHISTGAILNGNCTIGDGVFIGSNAVIANGIEICSYTLVGAGSMVNRRLIESGIYFGNPARLIKKSSDK